MRLHAALGLFIIACSAPAPDADSNDSGPLRPVVGKFWDIARNPNLGAYDNGMLQQPIAFGIWQAGDGTWQLWASIRNTNVGGNTRLFARWEAPRIASANWMEGGVAMLAEARSENWPEAFRRPTSRASATIGTCCTPIWRRSAMRSRRTERPSSGWLSRDGHERHVRRRSRHGHARSNALRRARRIPRLLHRGRGRRLRAHLARPRDVESTGRRGARRLGRRQLLRRRIAVRHPARRRGRLLPFRTQRYGVDAQTSVYRSPNPFDFGVDNDQYLIGTLPIAAPEIIRYDGQWFIAALRPDLQGIQMASLYWKHD